MLDTYGHGSGNTTLRRPNPVVILTPSCHKPKELQQPVDTLSQVSTQDDAEMVEASLEGVPMTISPFAMTTRSQSFTPPIDVSELQENANKALEELLATKASIDAHRQRAIWELGMELCQNESETTESIKKARAICSCVTLDAKALCFATIKESQDHLHLHHPGGQSCLLYGHQGCQDLEGLPGQVTLQATWQSHARSGGASHPTGRQKPN